MVKWLRKIGAVIAAYMLGIALLAASSAAVFHFVLASPDKVKGILDDSGIYNSLADTLLDSSTNKTQDPLGTKKTKQSDSVVPFDNPAIKKIVKKAFPPKVLQTNAEKLIDGTYDWLEGKTQQIELKLDLTQSKNILANEIGKYVRKRAAKLPRCDYSYISKSIDVFDANCLPYGITPAQIGAQTTRDIKSDKNFLPDTKITPDDIFGKKSADDPLKSQSLPSQFRLLKNLLWVLLVVALLLAAGTIMLSENWLKGIGKAAKSFVAVGVFVLITPLLLSFVSSRVSSSGLFNDPAAQDLALPVINSFISAVSIIYYIFGSVCVIIGIGALIYAHKAKNKRQNNLDK